MTNPLSFPKAEVRREMWNSPQLSVLMENELDTGLGGQPLLGLTLCWPSVPAGCSSITEAVTILGNKLVDYQRHFTARDLLALCDYSHNTFIRHFRLYQYVLGQARTVHLTVTHLEVCTPPQPLPLAEGMHRDMWNHQQQVAALEATEEQKRRELRLLREALREEEGRLLEQTFASMQPQGTEGTQPHQGLCREVSRAPSPAPSPGCMCVWYLSPALVDFATQSPC